MSDIKWPTDNAAKAFAEVWQKKQKAAEMIQVTWTEARWLQAQGVKVSENNLVDNSNPIVQKLYIREENSNG